MKITINRPHGVVETLVLLLAIPLFVGFATAMIVVAIALLTLSLPAIGIAWAIYSLRKKIRK